MAFVLGLESLNDVLKPSFITHLFRVPSFKSKMISRKRANIQNLNQKLLSNLEIPIPDVHSQNQFIKRVQAIETQKAQAEASLNQARFI